MTQTQMEYFEKVYELKNIAKAAEALFVSRPVVSRAILGIEHEFGCGLFTRSKTGVEVTESGELIHDMLKNMTNLYQGTRQHIVQCGALSDQRPEIRIGISRTNINRLYTLLCLPFIKAHPDINLKVLEYPTTQVCDAFRRNEIDFAFSPKQPYGFSSLESLDVFHDKMSLCVSKTFPLAQKDSADTQDLSDLPLALLGVPVAGFERVLKTRSIYIDRLNVVLKTSSASLLQQLTESGQVCSILPEHMVEHWDHVKALPLSFYPPITHNMYWNISLSHNSAASEFIRYATKIMSDRPTGRDSRRH